MIKVTNDLLIKKEYKKKMIDKDMTLKDISLKLGTSYQNVQNIFKKSNINANDLKRFNMVLKAEEYIKITDSNNNNIIIDKTLLKDNDDLRHYTNKTIIYYINSNKDNNANNTNNTAKATKKGIAELLGITAQQFNNFMNKKNFSFNDCIKVLNALGYDLWYEIKTVDITDQED